MTSGCFIGEIEFNHLIGDSDQLLTAGAGQVTHWSNSGAFKV